MVQKSRTKQRPGRLSPREIQDQRERIFQRDRGICQDCGIDTIFNAPEEWPNSFHRAHIKGKRMYGDDDSNVKTSCGQCHRDHHNGTKRGKFQHAKPIDRSRPFDNG